MDAEPDPEISTGAANDAMRDLLYETRKLPSPVSSHTIDRLIRKVEESKIMSLRDSVFNDNVIHVYGNPRTTLKITYEDRTRTFFTYLSDWGSHAHIFGPIIALFDQAIAEAGWGFNF